MKMWQDLTPQEKSGRSFVMAIICFSVCFFCAIYVFAGLWTANALQKRCTAETTGEILTVHSIGKYNYQAYVSAKFSVGGTEYRCSGQYSSDDGISTFQAQHPPVTIHYDPDDPSKAYACGAPKTPQLVFWVVVFGVMFLGGWLAVGQGKKIQSNPEVSEVELARDLQKKTRGFLKMKINVKESEDDEEK